MSYGRKLAECLGPRTHMPKDNVLVSPEVRLIVRLTRSVITSTVLSEKGEGRFRPTRFFVSAENMETGAAVIDVIDADEVRVTIRMFNGNVRFHGR